MTEQALALRTLGVKGLNVHPQETPDLPAEPQRLQLLQSRVTIQWGLSSI